MARSRPRPEFRLWPERWDGWIVLGAALIVRLIYLTEIRGDDPFYAYTMSGFDQHTYQRQAIEIAGGDWLLRNWNLFYYSPLYAYFSGLVYTIGGVENFDLLHGLQALLGAGACWMLWALARTCLTRGEALLSGAVAVFCQSWLFYEQLLLMEGLNVFLIVASLYLLRTAELGRHAALVRLLGAGLVSGLAFSGRGNYAALIPIYIIWIFALRSGLVSAKESGGEAEAESDSGERDDASIPDAPNRRAWGSAAVGVGAYALGLALILGPLGWRNHTVAGKWVFGTTNGPAMLYLGNASDANGEFLYSPRFSEAHALNQQEPDIYTRRMREDLAREPMKVIAGLLRKTRYFWNAYDIADNTSFYIGKSFSLLLRLASVPSIVILAFGLLGLGLSPGRWRGESLLWLFTIFFSVSIILILPVGRYKIPILAPMIIFGSRAALWLADAFRLKRWDRVGIAAAALSVLFLALYPYKSFAKVYGAGAPLIRYVDYVNFSSASLEKDKLDTAGRIIRTGLADYPGTVQLHIMKFRLSVAARNWDSAREQLPLVEQVRDQWTRLMWVSVARLNHHDGQSRQARAILMQLLDAQSDYEPARELMAELDGRA